MHVTASAPAAATAPATSTIRSVLALSFAQRGRPQPAVAAITSADSSGSWAKIASRPSRFGHDRLTSTATTPAGAAASSSAAPAVVVDRAAPDRRHDGGARSRSRSGSTWSSQYGDAGTLQADGVEHPLAVGCSRGAGLPAHSKAASDLTTTAPSADRSR